RSSTTSRATGVCSRASCASTRSRGSPRGAVDAPGPVRAFDRFQQRHPALAVPVAVGRKFGDDEGGNLTALIAYRAFFSLFPLLLLLTSILGFVLADDPGLRKDAIDSVLGQFPVVGEQIRVGTLEGSGVALAIGIVGSLWARLGVVLATGEALDKIWEVPKGERPGYLSSRLRSLAMLAILGSLT